MLRPPGDPEEALVGEPHLYQPLGPVTWELAMRGSREQLLPEIAGPAAYRVALGTNLRDVVLTGVVQAAVNRLHRDSANLREMAEWPGLNRARAMRLLNALYLQGGLIVSRTHPVASNESWFGSTTKLEPALEGATPAARRSRFRGVRWTRHAPAYLPGPAPQSCSHASSGSSAAGFIAVGLALPPRSRSSAS